MRKNTGYRTSRGVIRTQAMKKAWITRRKNGKESPWNKGISFSKGEKNGMYGRKHSEESKYLMSIHREKKVGSKNPAWKGGVTPINHLIRNSSKYQIWRRSVFKRDNWTCIECGSRSEKGKRVTLNADHIKPFAYFPELRFNINNGRTLCVDCHKMTDTYKGKAKLYAKNR